MFEDIFFFIYNLKMAIVHPQRIIFRCPETQFSIRSTLFSHLRIDVDDTELGLSDDCPHCLICRAAEVPLLQLRYLPHHMIHDLKLAYNWRQGKKYS